MKTNATMLVKNALMAVLRHDANTQHLPTTSIPTDPHQQRELLGDILIASNHVWNEETLTLIDQVYQHEVDHVRLPPVSLDDVNATASTTATFIPLQSSNSSSSSKDTTQIVVWRGDITRLQVDFVVNAANDAGLGCFLPAHRCIDNVLHRGAGPRLRIACRHAMQERAQNQQGQDSQLLAAGTPPIITSAYFLPSHHVVHVTGPQIVTKTVSLNDQEALAAAYRHSLDAALSVPNINATSIAFPCISTGVFGFPQEQAVHVALTAVRDWLQQQSSSSTSSRLKMIIFDVFTDKDEELYRKYVPQFFSTQQERKTATSATVQVSAAGDVVTSTTAKKNIVVDPTLLPMKERYRHSALLLAKRWIDQADAILITGGAGMSVKEGEMVYVNEDDFARHYPYFVKWGFRTTYETMGLIFDPSMKKFPATAKWALYSKHIYNMRWGWTPNQGYEWLRELIGNKDYFVYTSNADGCFERAGFDPSRIYTPQGDFAYLQCMRACRRDAVFPSRPYLDAMISQMSPDGHVPVNTVPKCPYCGYDMFGNVRGDEHFLHTMYDDLNTACLHWMETVANDPHKSLVVIEIGAGYNTPMVTRWPDESLVRFMGPDRAHLIRINPDHSAVPPDISAVAIPEGWQVLHDLLPRKEDGDDDDDIIMETEAQIQQMAQSLGLLDTRGRNVGRDQWKNFMHNIRH